MKIGVFSGTFDPIHNGHLSFAQAALDNGLDEVWFLPERQPRGKEKATDYEHRLEMLKLALAERWQMRLIELPDTQFSLKRSLPKIQAMLPKEARLSLLLGSDVAQNLSKWPDLPLYEGQFSVVVGERTSKPDLPQSLPHTSPHISSGAIRGGEMKEVPSAVLAYIKKHHLYR